MLLAAILLAVEDLLDLLLQSAALLHDELVLKLQTEVAAGGSLLLAVEVLRDRGQHRGQGIRRVDGDDPP